MISFSITMGSFRSFIASSSRAFRKGKLAELAKEPDVVATGPVLHDLSVVEPEHVDLLGRHLAARRRDRHDLHLERPRLRAADRDAARDTIALGDQVLARDALVGHRLPELRQ